MSALLHVCVTAPHRNKHISAGATDLQDPLTDDCDCQLTETVMGTCTCRQSGGVMGVQEPDSLHPC